ncbi:MAG: hypothetical protein KJI69_03605 [Patescibacteria group bacterium]|nr:hypothetical protein [Patescibacteria group bacterium]
MSVVIGRLENGKYLEEKFRKIGKQRLDLIAPFVYISKHALKPLFGAKYPLGIKSDYGTFERLPTKIAEKLLTGYPNIAPKDTQNYSPTAKKLVTLAKKYKGTVGGYFINEDDERRDDQRITLESIYLKTTKEQAEKLRDKIHPDEFHQEEDGTWRFWWD